MKLNRSLIKTQAKGLIKGQVFTLFLLTFVVCLLTGTFTLNYNFDDIDKLGDAFDSSISSHDGVVTFDDDQFDRFVEDALGSQQSKHKNNVISSIMASLLGALGSVVAIAKLFLTPLLITLMGVYVMLVHGNKLSLGDSFKYTFKFTFNKYYWNKLLCNIVTGIIVAALFLVFLIPGIIFYYRYYFASFILADNPNLSAKQAVKLSIKMTEGHKGELFSLDLSFLSWALLLPITLGLISIYTMPYYLTTKALYYENFKARAISNGTLTPRDFEENTFDAPVAVQANQMQQPSQQAQQYYTPQPAPQPVEQPQPTQQSVNFEAQTYQEPFIPTQPQQPQQTTPVITVEEPTSGTFDFGTGSTTDYYNTNV